MRRNFRLRLSPFDATHDRAAFNSDSEPLNRYLREQVTQDVRSHVAACFVALADAKYLAGYYTLASSSVLLSDIPASTGRKLPRYPTVPAVRMGRLAVDQTFKGLGLGGALLADAIDRAARAEIAAYALIVDAKEEAAVDFYRHHGFIALPDSPRILFLPLATVQLSLVTRHSPQPEPRTVLKSSPAPSAPGRATFSARHRAATPAAIALTGRCLPELFDVLAQYRYRHCAGNKCNRERGQAFKR